MFRKMLFCISPLFIILLFLSCTRKPVAPKSDAPVINAIEASPNIVSKDGKVYLNLAVTDPEEDKMYFEWSCTDGSFFSDSLLQNASNTANPCWWQAPSNEGNYTINVTCTDSLAHGVNDKLIIVDTSVTVSVSIYSLDSIIGKERFASPFAMYLDEDGNIFVSDPGLSCIHAYKNNEWYRWNFAGLDSDSVWMYDTTGYDTIIDTTTTPPETTITAVIDTLFDSLNIFESKYTTPSAISIDENNHLLYVADVTIDSTILSVYDIDNIGSPLDTLYGFLYRISDQPGELSYPINAPYSFVVNPSNRWLYMSTEHLMIAYDSTWFYNGWVMDWQYSLSINYVGHGLKLFNGNLYLACFSTGNNYVRRFSNIITPHSSPEIDFEFTDTTLQYVAGIAIAQNGHIYVTETGGSSGSYNRVVEYDENGNYVRSFGSLGDKDDQFNCPTDIFIGNTGKIYVVDMGNHCIKVFTK